MFEFLLDDLLPTCRPAAGLKHQPVGGMLRGGPIGVHGEHERTAGPRQVARADLEPQVALAVAVKIDPGRLERLVALGDERHPGPFDGPQIPLPLHRLPLAVRVGGILVPHLADQERRRIDHGDPDRFAAGVTSRDDDLDRLVEPAAGVGQQGGVGRLLARTGIPAQPAGSLIAQPAGWLIAQPAGWLIAQPAAGTISQHLDPPGFVRSVRGRRLGAAEFADRRDGEHRPLAVAQPIDATGDDQLPATDDRRPSCVNLQPAMPAVAVRPVVGRLVGQSPVQPRRLDPHPRRRGDAGPRGDQPGRGHEEALGSRQFIDGCQTHEHGQRTGQSHRIGTIDDAVGRQLREPLGGPAFERPHDQRRAPLRMRLHQHGVDQVVVEVGVFLLDGPGGVDQVHAIAHQRHDPADHGGQERRDARRQPGDTKPARQAAGHQPVLEEDAAGQPEQHPDAGTEQEGRQGHALEIGAGRRQSLGQIAIRFRFPFARVGPFGDRERVAAEDPAGSRPVRAMGGIRMRSLRSSCPQCRRTARRRTARGRTVGNRRHRHASHCQGRASSPAAAGQGVGRAVDLKYIGHRCRPLRRIDARRKSHLSYRGRSAFPREDSLQCRCSRTPTRSDVWWTARLAAPARGWRGWGLPCWRRPTG